MKTKGYAAKSAGALLENYEFNRRELRPRDVALDIYYAGICHSDIHQAREEWGPSIFPMVPGHEIVGKVIEIGSQGSKFKVGEIIGVGSTQGTWRSAFGIQSRARCRWQSDAGRRAARDAARRIAKA